MGLFGQIKEARQKTKQTKRNHFVTLITDSITDGSYQFFYGYNSEEEFKEIIEVIDDINKELSSDKLMLTVATRAEQPITITVGDKEIGKFVCYCLVKVSTLE